MTIYRNDIASIVESIYMDSDTSIIPSQSDTIVNPEDDGWVGKTIIFSYVPNPRIDLKKLSKNNHIISRIPIDCSDYELVPYDPEFTTKKIRIGCKVPKILSPFLLKSTEYTIKNGALRLPRYRLATDLTTNGYLNIVGLLSKLMKINNSWKDFISVIRENTPRFRKYTKLFDSNSVYKYTLKNITDTYDICTEDQYYVGPKIRRRRPDKRMNVRYGYVYGKFKTYRITDKVRSLDINYNTIDGFHLFYLNKSELDPEDIVPLVLSGGLELVLYLLYFFIKKNHFKEITGNILTEPLSHLKDPNGIMSINISILPMGLVDDESVFYLSLLGLSKNY